MLITTCLRAWAAAAVVGLSAASAMAGNPGGRPYSIGGFGRGGGEPDQGLVGGWAPGYGGYGPGYAGFMRGAAYPGYYGPTYHRGFGFGYPFFPYYPGAYQNSWSNGFALQGPPVPTDAPIPGRFGGSDQKFYGLSPSPISGFGPNFGTNPSTLPRGTHPGANIPILPYVASTPTPVPHLTPVPGAPAQPDGIPLPPPRKVEPGADVRAGLTGAQRVNGGESSLPAGAVLDVTMPDPSAVLLIDGRQTSMLGAQRLFKSPPLQPGRIFTYELEARWLSQGEMMRVSRVVEVEAGQLQQIDLSQAAVSR